MIPTLRRLNDRERYFGLTWPGWLAAAAAAAVVYGAVRLSPFGVKPTVTIVALLLAALGMLVLAVSGQALSPARHLAALIRYRTQPSVWVPSERPDRRGLVLDRVPGDEDDERVEPVEEQVAAGPRADLDGPPVPVASRNGMEPVIAPGSADA